MRYKAGLKTRDKILKATSGLIAEAGLEGTTIKAICDRAGVLPGSFYNLFDSKEQVIMAVVREAIDAVDPDPEHLGTDTLADLVDAYVRFTVEKGDLARVYVRIALSSSRNDSELRGRMLHHHEARVTRFAEAISREHPEITDGKAAQHAETLVSALNGVAIHRVLDPSFDVALHANALMQMTAST